MTFVAGGTDWIIRNRGRLSDDAVVADLSLIDEMRGISLDGGYLRIGALETMTSLHRSALVRKYASALADAAYVMGSEQIRNRTTVGGNVANSSPAADTPPASIYRAAISKISSTARSRRRMISYSSILPTTRIFRITAVENSGAATSVGSRRC